MSTVTDAAEMFGELGDDLDEAPELDALADGPFRLEAPRPREAPDGLPGLHDPDDDGEDLDEEAEWPVVLLDGKVVRGPFHRPGPDGGPMLEVHAVVRRGRKLHRGGHLGRLPHDADEEDLAELVGQAGMFYLVVRSAEGKLLAGTTVRLGPRRRAPESVEPDERPASVSAEGGELAQALKGIGQVLAQQQELLSRVLHGQAEREAKLQEQLLQLEREQRERELQLREQESRAAREEIEATNRRFVEAIEARQLAAPAKTQDPVEAIAETIAAGERLKAVLAEKFGLQDAEPEVEGDFVEEVGAELERLSGLLKKLHGLKSLGGGLLSGGGPGQ